MIAQRAGETIGKILAAIGTDIFVFAGIGLAVYGVSLFSRSGAFITAGVCLVLLGLLASKR